MIAAEIVVTCAYKRLPYMCSTCHSDEASFDLISVFIDQLKNYDCTGRIWRSSHLRAIGHL